MAYVKVSKKRAGVPARLDEPLSPAQIDIFFKHLREEYRPSLREILRDLNISKAVFQKTIDTNADFREAVEKWKADQLGDIEEIAFEQARAGDGAMTRFLLQQLKPEKYGPKAKLDVNLTTEQIMKLPDDQLEALLEQFGGKA